MRILVEKIWAYAVEVIAAGLIGIALWIWLGEQTITYWQVEKRADLLTFIGGAVVVSVAIFAAYFAILSTEFGKELRIYGVAAEYLSAFSFPMILFVITSGTLEMLTKESDPVLPKVITFLLCYSCINCITMVRNIIGIVRLWQDVERVNGKGGSV